MEHLKSKQVYSVIMLLEETNYKNKYVYLFFKQKHTIQI